MFLNFCGNPELITSLYFIGFQTGNLAMESLLSLTSRRAGEWFKEELRSLGALDHIVDTGTYIIVLLWSIGPRITMSP